MAATPFSLQGSLVFPPDDGQPNATRAFSQSGSFTQKSEQDLVLTGAGSMPVGFGTITTLKACVIEVDIASLAPVKLKFNGGTDTVEISPGGFWAYSNPVPVAPVTSIMVVYTMDARVQARLLG